MTRRFPLVLASALLALPLHAADSADTGEARLREALRAATLQLRAAESARDTLQASQAALTGDNKALDAKFEALRKQTVAERAVDEKTIAELKAAATTQTAELARLKEELEKSEANLKRATAQIAAKEADGTKLAADLVVLQRKVEDRESKNLALFKLGNEILTRYEKFSLGEALAAREPFVGTTRAKLENLVQDYSDQLLDQRAKP